MTFQREHRYIVIKRKDLAKVSPTDGDLVQSYLQHIRAILDDYGATDRQCLVIESDWPEYEPAWAMIEARVAGKPVEPTGWLDPATGDFLTTEGRANTLAMGHGARLERYSVALYAAPPAATALPPDDQDEAYRLHRAFIAVDEPNNEQVMAFQDASYVLGLKRGQAHEAALQQRLNEADQRIDELMRDKHRLDALGDNFWDVRHHSTALADTGDCTSGVDIIGHWMDKPHERVIGENYNENLRAAIDQAMTADAYPPARPEYPELDAALDQLTNDSWEVRS